VQFKGTIILDYMERMETAKGTAESNLRRLKEALVSSGSFKVEGLFPEHFPDDAVEDDSDAPFPEGSNIDYSAVDWKAPSDGGNAEEEYRALMAQVAGAKTGSFSGDKLQVEDLFSGWR
jgi:hypothetical protein